MGGGQQTPVRQMRRVSSHSLVNDADGAFLSSPSGDAVMDLELADMPTEEGEEQLDFNSLLISQPEEVCACAQHCKTMTNASV